jgi:hypothetical protein
MSQKNQIDYEYVRLITKSTFHYYKYDEKNKSLYFIFQEITRRKGTSKMNELKVDREFIAKCLLENIAGKFITDVIFFNFRNSYLKI